MAGGRRPWRPAGHHADDVVAYIIRRLIARGRAAASSSASSPSRSSSWCPGSPAPPPDDLASRYVGKTAGAGADPRDRARSSASPTRSTCSTAASSRASSSARTTTPAPTTEHCPAPCFGYSFITQNPVLPDLLDRLPVTLSLAVGAAVHLAGRRRRDRRALRAAQGQRLRPGGDGRRAGRRLAADLLHRPAVAVDLQLHAAAGPRPAAATRRSRENPAAVGLRPDPAVDHAGVPVRRRLRPAHPGRACSRR